MRVRLVKDDEHYDPIIVPDSLDTLKCFAIEAFGSFEFSYVYLTDEGDLKEINTDEELSKAIFSMRQCGQETLVLLLENIDRYHSYIQEPIIDSFSQKTAPIKSSQNSYDPPEIIYELDEYPSETKLAKQKSAEFGMKPLSGKHIEKMCKQDEIFEQKIKVINSGIKVWDGVTIKLEKGTVEILLINIPRLRPDQTGEIILKIRAPSIQETINFELRMYTASGVTFGSSIFFEMIIASQNLIALVGMGFGFKESQLALDLCGNNLDAAIHSLIGDRDHDEERGK